MLGSEDKIHWSLDIQFDSRHSGAIHFLTALLGFHMDQMKLDYFVSRYADFDEDALAELQSRSDTLAEEAATALDIVLAKRGIDKALLVQRAIENEESPPKEPKRSKGLMVAQLIAVAVIVVFSKALAEILPPLASLIVVLGILSYWVFRWFRK